ncbi:MAG: IS1595 family transposase [Gammaproteobacteria bacterium]|nr:IS1595 family transposase [Gammaproteobacteria bacterium]
MPKPYREIDLITFQRRFGTEAACRKRLFALRWPEGFKCPQCGCNESYFLEKRALYQCVACKLQTSLTAGTIMHRTRTPLVKWFWAIYLVSTDKRGLSALDLSRKIDIGTKCAWTMLHKVRKAMKARDANYQLAGLVQVDDAFFNGGGKGGDKRGRGTRKVPVLVLAATKDEAITFARMEVLESVNKEHVKEALELHVAPNQRVKSDGLPVFNVAKELGHEHFPEVVYPRVGEPNYDAFKWVNIMISNAKAFILGTYHGVMKKHLQRYLDEFCYRFNRRFWPDQRFERLLLACANTTTVTYAELRQ